MTPRARQWLPLGLFALLAFPHVPGADGLLGMAGQAALFTIIAASLVMLTGWVSQISLAHGALVGIGAFATGWAVTVLGIGFPLSLPVAMLLAGAVATLLGAVALRVRGLYLAVATLIFSWAASEFLFRQSWVRDYGSVPQQTIGEPGMVFFFDFSSRTVYYYTAWALALFSLFALANLRDSKTGRAFFAIRGSEMAAASLGMDVLRYKALAFGLSGAMAGMAGSLMMTHTLVVTPDGFGFQASLFFLAIAVVGGLASLPGAVAAGFLFAILEELFFRVALLNEFLQLASAGLLVAVFLAYPGGLAAMGRTLVARWHRARAAVRERAAAATAGPDLAAAGLTVPAGTVAAGGEGAAGAGDDTTELPPVAVEEVPRLTALVRRVRSRLSLESLLVVAARVRRPRPAGIHEQRVLALELTVPAPAEPVDQPAAGDASAGAAAAGGEPDAPTAPAAGEDQEEPQDVVDDATDDDPAEAQTFTALLDRVAALPKPDPARRMERRPLIEADGVTVRFGGLTAVDDASLSVREGEIVGLIGPNGAGKTTLFNSIAGFNQPTEGRVRLYGQDVTDASVHERAQLGVARTFQLIQLFPQITVFDNLLAATHLQNPTGFLQHLSVTSAALEAVWGARQRVRRVVELLQLEEVADRPVAGLPFGVLRMVEVARALVGGAPVVMLDEPASGLDERETDRFIDLLRVVRGLGATLLLIEHDVRMVTAVSDYLYVIDRGKLIAQGSPSQVQADPAVIAAYLGQADADGEAPPAPAAGDDPVLVDAPVADATVAAAAPPASDA
jgi:ABC-type branched-subunit amino acid transport system ATPase component/ABC-type branched-subunit amino acid transport system permease subunit